MFLGSEDAGTKKVVGNLASELDCDGVDVGHWLAARWREPPAGSDTCCFIPAESHGVAGAAPSAGIISL